MCVCVMMKWRLLINIPLQHRCRLAFENSMPVRSARLGNPALVVLAALAWLGCQAPFAGSAQSAPWGLGGRLRFALRGR